METVKSCRTTLSGQQTPRPLESSDMLGSWTNDLPQSVKAQFHKLVKTTSSLPLPPKRTTIGYRGFSPSKQTAPRGDGEAVARSTAVAGIHRGGDGSQRVAPAAQAAGVEGQRATVASQCESDRDELSLARARVNALQQQLAVRVAQHTMDGPDRCALEEVLGRRAIETHHAELQSYIVASWEAVRVLHHRMSDAMRRASSGREEVASLTRANEILREKQSASEQTIANLKALLDVQRETAQEIGAQRRALHDEQHLRAAAEVKVAKLRSERNALRQRVSELDETVGRFRNEVDGMSERHRAIVADLEHSLRNLAVGDVGNERAAQEEPCSVGASSTLMATVSDIERKRLELQFSLNDAEKELAEAKSCIRTLRCTLTENTLQHQQHEAAWKEERARLQQALEKRQQSESRLEREVRRLRTELDRASGTARELGACKAQLALLMARSTQNHSSSANGRSQDHNLLGSSQATSSDPSLYAAGHRRADDTESISSVDVVDEE